MGQWVQKGNYSVGTNNQINFDTDSFSPWAFKTATCTTHSTITYDGNGGTGTCPGIFIGNGTTITLPANPYTKSQYEFIGWRVDGESTNRNEGSPYVVSHDVTIRAQWRPLICTITYTPGEGTGTNATQTVDFGWSTTVRTYRNCDMSAPANKFFSHWRCDQGQWARDYDETDNIYQVQQDLTLYAKYKDTVTVVYLQNGGEGRMASEEKLPGAMLTLPTCTITPPSDYRFSYWKVGTSSVHYNVGDQVSVPSTDYQLKVTPIWESIPQRWLENNYSAVWRANQDGWDVDVTFWQFGYLNGFTLTPSAGSTYNIPAYVRNNSGQSTQIRSVYNLGGKGFTAIGGKKVYWIASSAFANCTALQEISFPELKDIGDNAFAGCVALSSTYFPDVSIVGNGAFSGCTSITEISLPSAYWIGNNAFRACTSLSELTLPALSSFNNNTPFYNCGIRTLNLPLLSKMYSGIMGQNLTPSLTTISFRDCSYFGEYALVGPSTGFAVYIMSTSVAGFGEYACGVPWSPYVPRSIYVPASLYNQYVNTCRWEWFSSIFVAL